MVPESELPDPIEENDLPTLLAALLTKSENGGATVITRSGKPVAAIVSMDDYRAAEEEIDRRMGEWELPADDGVRHSLNDILAQHREESP